MFRYFFPKIRLREKLPLLPTSFSSDTHPHSFEADDHTIRLLKGAGVARTTADAHRLIHKQKYRSAAEIIQRVKPKRRRLSRLAKAWQRFKALF